MSNLVGLESRGLVKSFGGRPVIGGLDLHIRPGEFSVVLGPSGAGKTTLLRCLSGLLPATSGDISINGRPVTGVPPEVAVVFQDYSKSLYPWKTLKENVLFAVRKLDKKEAQDRAVTALERVGLADAADLFPWQVSGGMQQRATLARALVSQAPLVIMDEPFASVDALTKIHLEELLLSLWAETPFTCIFVTHDIEEAVFMGDRIFVLSGRPTKLLEEYEVDLPRPRDHIHTKSLARFAELREKTFNLIEGSGTVTTRSS
jgi:NitT/TauT family transport system ATP-binding protein